MSPSPSYGVTLEDARGRRVSTYLDELMPYAKVVFQPNEVRAETATLVFRRTSEHDTMGFVLYRSQVAVWPPQLRLSGQG